jgi:hypothetical protein
MLSSVQVSSVIISYTQDYRGVLLSDGVTQDSLFVFCSRETTTPEQGRCENVWLGVYGCVWCPLPLIL